MTGQREIHLAEEWAGIGRALGVVVRRPFLVIAGTLACAVLGVFLAATLSPTHRASVTLQLGDLRGANPLQERLETPTGTVDVAEAMPMLTSDAVLAEVVRAPLDGKLSTPEHPERPVRLGLTTWVEDVEASPFSAWSQRLTGQRSSNFRLLASAVRIDPDALPHMEVRFEDGQTLTLSNAQLSRTIEFVPGQPVRFAGIELQLQARGRVDNRSWTIDILNEEQAVDRLRSRLRVSSPDEDSGVVRIAVEDSDPARTAEMATAVAQAFLDQDSAQIEQRTRTTAEQVGARLAQQRSKLAKIETDVARIRVSNPDVLHPERSAQLLGEARLSLEAELRRAQALEDGLFDTVRRLEQGEYAQASRLGAELDDARIVKLLETITSFEDQRQRVGTLERSGYADVLQSEADNAVRARRLLQVKAKRLHEIGRRFRAGDDAALGALGDAFAQEGATPTETLTQLYIADFSSTSQELVTLKATYTDEWWQVSDAKARLASLREQILSHLETKADLIRTDLDAAQAWEIALASKRDARPRDVTAAADAALTELWQRVVAAFGARLEGASAQRARLEDALRDVLARLMRLPEDQRRIAEPLLERETLVATVSQLSSIHGAALMATSHAESSANLLVPAASRAVRTGPRLAFSGLIGLVLGLLATFGLATISERQGGRRHLGGGMGTGLQLLGEIPQREKDQETPALLFASGSLEASAQRSARGRIDLVLARGPKLHHLGVRAMQPGGGASTTALGLALAWAEAGLKTLVIDGADGGLTRHLGLPPGRGWAEFLEAPEALESCSISVGHPLLQLLTASTAVPEPQLTRAHLEALSQAYDRIVVDLPSLEDAGTDSCTSQLDGTLLVHGPKDLDPTESLAPINRLEQAGVHLIGIVRTAVSTKARAKRKSA